MTLKIKCYSTHASTCIAVYFLSLLFFISVYVKHVCYTNFTKFNLPTPIYVNLVRDPIERIISWFYYIRASWYFVERKQAFPDLPLPNSSWLRKDFETCVLRGDPECTYTQGEIHEGKLFKANIMDYGQDAL